MGMVGNGIQRVEIDSVLRSKPALSTRRKRVNRSIRSCLAVAPYISNLHIEARDERNLHID